MRRLLFALVLAMCPMLAMADESISGQWQADLGHDVLIEEQRHVNSGVPAIARDLGLSLVCTNDVHYLRETDAHPHDVLLCIGTGKAFSDPKRLRYDARQFFLKTPEEMAAAFGDFPDALSNTLRIAERCNVVLPAGTNHLPSHPEAGNLPGHTQPGPAGSHGWASSPPAWLS